MRSGTNMFWGREFNTIKGRIFLCYEHEKITNLSIGLEKPTKLWMLSTCSFSPFNIYPFNLPSKRETLEIYMSCNLLRRPFLSLPSHHLIQNHFSTNKHICNCEKNRNEDLILKLPIKHRSILNRQ